MRINMNGVLEEVEKNSSSENIKILLDKAATYKYNVAEAQVCANIYYKLFVLGEKMFSEEKYFESYNIFTTSSFFVSNTDWPSNFLSLKAATRSAIFFNTEFGMCATLLLVKFLNQLKPSLLLSQPLFLDELYDAAKFFIQLPDSSAEHKYKGAAIIVLKLIIKLADKSSYEKFAEIKQVHDGLLLETLQTAIARSLVEPGEPVESQMSCRR